MSLPTADLVDLLADVLLRHQGSTGCGPDCICRELHELPRVSRALHRRAIGTRGCRFRMTPLAEMAQQHGFEPTSRLRALLRHELRLSCTSLVAEPCPAPPAGRLRSNLASPPREDTFASVTGTGTPVRARARLRALQPAPRYMALHALHVTISCSGRGSSGNMARNSSKFPSGSWK